MTVAELIECLRAQDQDRVVHVLAKAKQPRQCYDAYEWVPFDTELHLSSHFAGELQLGSDD